MKKCRGFCKRHYILLLFIAQLLFISCSSNKLPHSKKYKVETIDSEVYSRFATAYFTDGVMNILYSDEVTLSLKKGIKKENCWDISFVDKVDIDEKINPVMGKHFIEQNEEGVSVFYLDYQSEKKRFLKKIDIKKDSKNYFNTSLTIDCSDFSFAKGDFEYLFYIQNDSLKCIKIAEKSGILPIKLDQSNFLDIIDFSIYKNENGFTVVYLDRKGSLFIVTLKNSGDKIDILNSENISDNVSLYNSFESDNSVNVVYYDKDNLVSCYTGSQVLKVGYYPFVSHLYGSSIDGNKIITVSAIDKTSLNADIYGVFLVHRGKNGKWGEEKILESDSPISNVISCNDDKDLFMVLSSSFLQMVTIPLKSL